MDLTTRLLLTRPPDLAMRGLLRTRRRLRKLRDRLMPANGTIIERSLAPIESRCLAIAAELDLARLLNDRPRSTVDLAERTGVDVDALERLLMLLSSTGVFARRRDGRWANTGLSDVLDGDHPLSVRDWARFFGSSQYFQILGGADRSVATGQSATEATHGVPFFSWVTDVDPAAGELFDAAQRDGSRLVGLSLVREVDFATTSTICDVGGGTGRLIGQLLANLPETKGVLFDLPAVVDRSPDVLAEYGVSARVETVGGSFFDVVPSGHDTYVLVSVVHDWDDAQSAEILAHCATACGQRGRVLVVEQVLDPDRAPMFERHSDMLMLILTGAGRERTDARFRSLFDDANLEVRRTWTLATLHTVYELISRGAEGPR
jgi:hypothetical protein